MRHGEQIASNFVQARRLFQEHSVASEAVSTDSQTSASTAKTQILHALYVAAHATTVALAGMSVTCKIAWTLMHGDANAWLSDLRRWRSSPR